MDISLRHDKINEIPNVEIIEKTMQTGIVIPNQRTLYFHNEGYMDHWLNGMISAKAFLGETVNILPADYDNDDTAGTAGDDATTKAKSYQLALDKLKTIDASYNIEYKGDGLYRAYIPGAGEGTTLRQLDGINNMLSWIYGYAYGRLTANLFS
jgi:hypothetical protein